jgi:hypothetical protein
MLEILLGFRVAAGDCPFEPHPGQIYIPLHSCSIEIKQAEIVHRLCIAQFRRLFKRSLG